MTSISHPVIPPQASNNASQIVASANPPSASQNGRAPLQTAGPASASGKTSYAGATKKAFPNSSTSGNSNISAGTQPQHATISPVNGKVAIPPAVPQVGTPTIINGNTSTSSSSGRGDHSRNVSVTMGAGGAPNVPNGASVVAKTAGGIGIQFGASSPAVANATLQLAPSSNALAVNSPSNPRLISPQTSPSPIPQPPASGGRPPSSLHGQSNSVNFGALAGADSNMRSTGMPQGPLAPGPQPSHLRRESSQSQHSDMGNHSMASAAGRGAFPQQGGRGRGYGSSYQPQASYSPGPNYRQTPNQQRNGQSMTPFQQPNRQLQPYPNSPHQAARSPATQHSQLAQQQPAQIPMPGPHPGQQQYGAYPHQYGYPPNMGPQHYGMPQQYDPNFVAQYIHFYGVHPGQNMPPPSSRPQMPPGPQTPFQGQYGTAPPASMSRTSSAISGTDRPTSSMGKPQSTSTTPATNNNVTASRVQSSTPAPKTNSFQIPVKKSKGIVIKNPNTNEIIDPKMPSTSPAPSSKSPAHNSAAPTPLPYATATADLSNSRTESKSVKTDEEKRAEMKEQIARKREADKAEEQRRKEEGDAKAAHEKEEAEEKLLKEKEDADARQREAAAAQMKAQESQRKNKLEAEEAEKAASDAKAEEDEVAKKAREAQELEEEIAKMEDGQEAENERRYQEKEKEEAARKEAASFKMADEEMKRAEREAAEAEVARLKELNQGESEDSHKQREDLFAALKKDAPATLLEGTPAVEDTSVDSGAVTPASETPAPAPSKGSTGAGKQKPAALKLETHKPVEPAQPSAALVSLRSARPLLSIGDVSYPAPINSPNPALNSSAITGKFKYDRAFLMQFSHAFTEKPSENWSDKVRETVGDIGEPSSARATPRAGASSGGSMMSGRQPSNNRTPLPQMGAFTGGRNLPSGTTSEQRFREANRNPPPSARPTMQNPLANLVSRPGGGFPQPVASTRMDRNPSATGANHANSPRNPSQRGGSQRGNRTGGKREDPKDNKAMPLTAGANLKPIEVTESGWKPRSVGANVTGMAGPAPGGDGLMAPDVVQRKVKSNLNKMTPNNFDKISGQILAIAGQSKDETDGRSLRQVIQLTFEKATDEAHWAEMYAQFCKRMLESMSPEIKDENILDKKGDVVVGGALFRKYLLTRCQTEFERGWKMNLPEKPEGETEEAAMLSDAYYVAAAAKRRGLGLVRFIGELYKLQMLTERIMHECVKKLVDYEGVPDEAEIESLTSLLRTIGEQLDNSEKGHSMMDAYFVRIKGMIELPEIPSRLKFMLMDIVDLRHKNRWHGKGGAIKGPTTLEAVRQQAIETERQKELQRMQENARRSGGGGGRPPAGRGDARNFSAGGQYGMMPPPDHQRNTVGMDDLRRLGSRAGSRQPSTQGPATFGPTSMFGSARGSNTRKPLGMAQKDESGSSSRVSTPPAQKDKKDKDEAAKSGANAFSALASLESSEPIDGTSPAASPPTANAQPVPRQPVDRQQSKSPGGQEPAEGESSRKEVETS